MSDGYAEPEPLRLGTWSSWPAITKAVSSIERLYRPYQMRWLVHERGIEPHTSFGERVP